MQNKLIKTFIFMSLIGMPINSYAGENDAEIKALSAEVKSMKQSYEKRINELERKIKNLQKQKAQLAENGAKSDKELPKIGEGQNAALNNNKQAQNEPPKSNFGIFQARPIFATSSSVAQPVANNINNANSFNPAIGVVLNGTFAKFSEKDNKIKGFAVGEEGLRGSEGLSLGESEISFSGNIDDKLKGNLITSIAGDGSVELEEAFIQTIGLPYGVNIKAGRSLANLGYLNDKHPHSDDFSDRPLPYRVFLDNAFNDDGVQASVVLPTDFYSEIGVGIWRGGDFPGADAIGSKPGSYSSYANVGGDIGENQSWVLGASYLHSKANGDGRTTEENKAVQNFKGNNDLYIADFKYVLAPSGNNKLSEIILQGEYFWRKEKGNYSDESIDATEIPYDKSQSGWYAQSVYKFLPKWRLGYRYTALESSLVPSELEGSALDSKNHDPYINSLMLDYTNSEFSRIRLQYNQDNVGKKTDNQILLQYTVSLGVHGAHKY